MYIYATHQFLKQSTDVSGCMKLDRNFRVKIDNFLFVFECALQLDNVLEKSKRTVNF